MDASVTALLPCTFKQFCRRYRTTVAKEHRDTMREFGTGGLLNGHVSITLVVAVSDSDEIIAAGQRSYGRDYGCPNDPVLLRAPVDLPLDADKVIPSAAAAATDLLIEAWSRCYGRLDDSLIEHIASAEVGEVIQAEFYPAEGP